MSLNIKTSDGLKQLAGTPISNIDDTTTATDTTYSSAKIEEKLASLITKVSNPTEGDFNKFTKEGRYAIGSTDSNNNMPVNKHGMLLVFSHETYITQIYVCSSDYTTTSIPNAYIRYSWSRGNTWSAWGKITTSTV